MRKLLVVAGREYTEGIRSRWFLVATLLGPLFFGTIMIVPIVLSARAKPSAMGAEIAIVDVTGTGVGQRIAAELAGGIASSDRGPRVQAVAHAGVAQAESTLTRAVMRHELTGYLVVDSATLAGQAAHYAGRNASSLPDMQRLTGAVRHGVLGFQLEREGLNPSHIEALMRVQPRLDTERITDTERGGSGLGSTGVGYVVAFLLYMMIILYGQNIMRGVTEEKTTRVAEVVVSSVEPDSLLAGKVVGVGLLSVTQQLIWLALTLLIVQARGPVMHALGVANPSFGLPHVSPGAGLLYFAFYLFGFTFYASLFAAMGATVSSQEDVQEASRPLVLLLVFTVMLLQPVLMEPMGRLAQVLSWVPFSAPIIMPLRMSVVPVSAAEIALTLVGLMAASLAAVWVAARIYRAGLLMYGKRPSLVELVRWVKRAG